MSPQVDTYSLSCNDSVCPEGSAGSAPASISEVKVPQQEEEPPFPSKQNVELGYITLEKSIVCLDESKDACIRGDQDVIENYKGIWMPVELLPPETDSGALPSPADSSSSHCRHCHVTLALSAFESAEHHPPSQYKPVWRCNVDEIEAFDGTLGNAVGCSFCSCKIKRPDATLLLGMLRLARNEGIISIASLQVLLLKRVDDKDEVAHGVGAVAEEGGSIYYHAALVVTLSFPRLLQEPTAKDLTAYRRCLLRCRNTAKNTTKPLHSSIQLLLAFIRSDWVQLENRMRDLEIKANEMGKDKNQLMQNEVSFFPSQHNLEELFLRIPSGTKREMELPAGDSTVFQTEAQTGNNEQCCLIDRLPMEMVVEMIAPFLRAGSLDALSRTCRHFRKSLRTVVPGLRLRLYSHQITSMHWMHQREAHLLDESDCLQSAVLRADAMDGDLHRAATGGQTVLLRSRGVDGFTIRLDQVTGLEVSLPQIGMPQRRLARGGAIIDEPGLGKTITVLSLILRTAGLQPTPLLPRQSTTSINSTSNTAGSGLETSHVATENATGYEEQIFEAYWKGMAPDFRRLPLLKLLNQLMRSHAGRFPFHMGSIQKAITNDQYGSSFTAFQADVEYV